MNAIGRREAQNAIRSLNFVDRHQVPGFANDEEAWCRFRDNPVRFFTKAPDPIADQIWAAAQRQPGAGS